MTIMRINEFGLTLMNHNKVGYKDKPFIWHIKQDKYSRSLIQVMRND